MVRFFAVALCLFCSQLFGQSIVGPGELPIPVGAPMLFQVTDAVEGDQIKWQLVMPQIDDVTVIETRSGAEYIVDTGCRYQGDVQVLCTVVNFETQRFEQLVLQAVVQGETPQPVDPPGPGPEPNPQPGQYDGPNAMGVGQISFDNAPEFDQAIIGLMDQAIGHLRGRPTLKVIYTSDRQRNNSEYNLIVWLTNSMKRDHPNWDTWFNKVFEHLQGSNLGVLNTDDWINAFREAQAGVNAKK